MRESRTPSQPILIGALLVMMCAIAVALGTSLASGAPHASVPRRAIAAGRTPLPAPLLARISRNRRALAHHFPALTRARAGTAVTALPERASEEINAIAHSDTPQGRIAPDPALAEYLGSIDAAALQSTMRVWLVPGANGVCLAEVTATSFGSTCVSDAEALSGGLTGTLETKAGLTTFGVIPGSASTASIEQTDGTTRPVAVSNGLWAVNGDPQAVSLAAQPAPRT